MSDVESSPVPPLGESVPPTLESLLETQQWLRRCLNATLIMLLVLSGSLFVFFLREVSLARRQITDLRKVVMDYEKNTYPLMENFRSKLQAFAQTHPDFNAIYLKYFGSATNSNPAQFPGGHPPQGNPNAARLPPAAESR